MNTVGYQTDKLRLMRQTEIMGLLKSPGAVVFATGLVTAAMQVVLVREVLTVFAGNEMVVGMVLAIWLAATAAGAGGGQKKTLLALSDALLLLLLVFAAGMVGIRAVRLLQLPGAALPPQLLPLLLLVIVAPGAATGGYIFGAAVKNGGGRQLYGREQAGTFLGLSLASVAVWRSVPNGILSAGVLLLLLPLLRGSIRRGVGIVVVAVLFLTDSSTTAWKYPLPVSRIQYTRDGEVATAAVESEQLTYVNGTLHTLSYATPAVEQAVHVPLSMLPELPRSILLLNSAGHLIEAKKYRGAEISCIRLDRLMVDSCCPFGRLAPEMSHGPFDAVLLACSMPDNISTSRYFTRSFFRQMKILTGDSGVFSFTLPFHGEYIDKREEAIRSIIITTLHDVFSHVQVFPGEGFTFLASDADYPLPDTCRVATAYFQPVVLAGLTAERIVAANRPPSVNRMHTAAHPRLLLPVLDGYLRQFSLSRWLFIGVPLLLVVVLLPIVRLSQPMASVGSTGMCIGVYSTGLIIMYQSFYGSLYSHLPLLLLSLSAGFAAGCRVRRFPHADLWIGGVLGGSLAVLTLYTKEPPVLLFFLCNAVAGFMGSAQFVTRSTLRTGSLYAADCTGGVLGMALAATILIPQFGLGMVAAGIVVLKSVSAIPFGKQGSA
jgi:spermidine synthase